jgi:hypothetical protein
MGGPDQAHPEPKPDPPDPGLGREGSSTEETSVLGSLPRRRPAVRSPRRQRPTAKPPQRPDAQPPSPGERSATAGREAEVEAVARAGISLAAEAATLGLRLAGRAAAALRESVERR